MAKTKNPKETKAAPPPIVLDDSRLRARLNAATAARDRIEARVLSGALVTIASAIQYRRLCAQIVRLRYLLGLQSGPAK